MSFTPSAGGPIIGVRDSGVGGLTVARRILEAIPSATLLYFADTAHVPYGDKTPEQICHYALSITGFLLAQGAETVIFACNTTSAYALNLARDRFAEPIFGVIEPAAREAARQSAGRVGVLATTATVQSGVYTRELLSARQDLAVKEVPCPALVPLVESGDASSATALQYCGEYLGPLRRANSDTVILGCTHYPLLLPLLENISPATRFVDPADPLASEVKQALEGRPPGRGGDGVHRFFVSGPTEGVPEWIEATLGLTDVTLESGPVFDLHFEVAAT